MKPLIAFIFISTAFNLYSQTPNFKLTDKLAYYKVNGKRIDDEQLLNNLILKGHKVKSVSVYNIFKMNPTGVDSLAREFYIKSYIAEINKYRLKLGRKPLNYEIGLKPIAEHRLYYLKFCFINNIIQVTDIYENYHNTLSHSERVDIPNFTETYEVNSDLKLIDTTKYRIYQTTEELLMQGDGFFRNMKEYDSITNNFVNFNSFSDLINFQINFWISEPNQSHWKDMLSEQWDCMYIQTDGTFTIIILGKYY